jgi:hypothetical protein
MNRSLPILALALAVLCAAAPAAAALQPYRDEAELRSALDRWRAAAQALQPRARREAMPMAAAPAMASKAADAGFAQATNAAPAAEASITNVQTAGVDEGGIVKRAGEHLVVLRRGRLFTVRVGGDALQPVAMVDAFAPGSDPRGAWYDELLVHGHTLVVVGYSYARGGTEIGLFELDADGRMRHRATHHLKSFDYYSARNYASRLVGSQLVFYSPTLLQPWSPAWAQLMPAARRWAAMPGEFQRILPATRIFRSDDDFDPSQPLALHTITRCELGRGAELPCESSAVLGPAGRVFYVSASAVTVWAAGRPADGGGAAAVVYRLPLDDGRAPSALKAVGMPTDQFSFQEDTSHLNVLLREAGRGEAMAGPAAGGGGGGRTALLRVPLAAFGDGRAAARREHYRLLPGPKATPRCTTASSAIGWCGAPARPPGRCGRLKRRRRWRCNPGTASNASRRWASTRCWPARAAAGSCSRRCGSRRGARRGWKAGSWCPAPRRAKRAAMASSTAPPGATKACWACRCDVRRPAVAGGATKRPRRWWCCASATWLSPRWANWPPRPARGATTAARPRAWTGTATPGLSFWATACSR